MKSVKRIRVIVGLGVLVFGGARAPLAAESGDGMEQARMLLSGPGTSASSSKSGLVSPSFVATNSVALDAQAQAREMILGLGTATTPIITANGLRAAGTRPDSKVARDPHEMARRMILGSQSAGSGPKIRLTVKQSN